MEISGTIKTIGSTNKISDKFSKRDLRIVTEGDYPQTIEIQFVNDKCAVLDKFKAGEIVSIAINIKGREWTNPKGGEVKCFNTIEGWKIDYAGQHADSIQGEKHQASIQDESDDLPF